MFFFVISKFHHHVSFAHLASCDMPIQELFGLIASALDNYVKAEGRSINKVLKGKQRELGFCFSFPVRQTSIASGTLIKWTKAFAVDDAVSAPCYVQNPCVS